MSVLAIAHDWAQRLAPRAAVIRKLYDVRDSLGARPLGEPGITEQELHRQLAILGAELMDEIETRDLVPDRR